MKAVPGLHPYPLQWPDGWPRRALPQQRALFKTTLPRAVANLEVELGRMGATAITITSNMALGTTSPKDPAVAVHFIRKDKLHILACDKFAKVEWNMQALARTVEALRQIERDGASEILERALGAFRLALPQASAWWAPLGLKEPPKSAQEVQEAFRTAALTAHPDRGGTREAWDALCAAKERAEQAVDLARGGL